MADEDTTLNAKRCPQGSNVIGEIADRQTIADSR
jgi:hypothetical protein